MKKILTAVMALCLMVALAATFAINAFAAEEELIVAVGSKFEWNDQSATPALQKAWIQSKGQSADGLWKYQMFVLDREMYVDLKAVYDAGFAHSTTPGSSGVGYARARKHGSNFHPGESADIVKTFICPSGGKIQIDTTVYRENAVTSQDVTGVSFAIYLESTDTNTLVYPTDGTEAVIINSADPQQHLAEIDVKAGERIHIHIGAVDRNQSGDSTNMSNVITYKSVNDESVVVSDKTISFNRETNTALNGHDFNNGGAGGDGLPVPGEEKDGSSLPLILGIVGGVVVVGAVVVFVIIKKRQQY